MHGAVLPAGTAIREMSRTMEESEGHFSLSVCGLFCWQRKLHFPNQNEVVDIPRGRMRVSSTTKKTYCQARCAPKGSKAGRVCFPSADLCTFVAFDCLAAPPEAKLLAGFGGSDETGTQFWGLAITGYSAQLTGQEMIRRPRPADGNLAVFQLLGGCIVAVLIFLDRL